MHFRIRIANPVVEFIRAGPNRPIEHKPATVRDRD
jgi:hypothetical protein